jgi:hypothetical protein
MGHQRLLHELHPLHIKKNPTNVDVEIVPAEGSYSIPHCSDAIPSRL